MIYVPILTKTNRGIEVSHLYRDSYTTTCELSSLLDMSMSEDLRIVVRFSLAKANLIEFLLRSRKWHARKNPKDDKAAYNIKEDFIELYLPKRTVYIVAYEKKFMQDFISFEVAHDLELADFSKRSTCAQDAKANYYATLAGDNYLHGRNIDYLRHPEPTAAEFAVLNKAKETCKGFFFCKAGEYKRAFSYDFKQFYASKLYKTWTPKGKPQRIHAISPLNSRYWHVFALSIKYATPLIFDFLGLNAGEFPQNVVLTQECFEIFQKYYISEYRFIDGYAYKKEYGVFDKFVGATNEICRQTETIQKHIRKYYKAQINLLIGTYAKNDTAKKVYKLSKAGITAEDTADDYRRPFLPVYLFVVGRALQTLIETIAPIWDSVVYVNTDGFITTKEYITFNHIEPHTVGALELRHVYTRCLIKAIGIYAGEWIDDDGVVQCDAKTSGFIANNVTYAAFRANTFLAVHIQRLLNGFADIIATEGIGESVNVSVPRSPPSERSRIVTTTLI